MASKCGCYSDSDELMPVGVLVCCDVCAQPVKATLAGVVESTGPASNLSSSICVSSNSDLRDVAAHAELTATAAARAPRSFLAVHAHA
jgi:hypothetical protein